MPKSRKEVNTSQDRKEGQSCAECKRSKLKCDRTFPCQACIRRGCASICPDGELTATKGNQALKNQNEALQREVKELRDRNRELEVALRSAHAQVSGGPHQLLRDDTGAKSEGNVADVGDRHHDSENATLNMAMGTLSIGDHDAVRYHGQTAGTELLQSLLQDESGESLGDCEELGLPWPIVQLAYAFPFGLPGDASAIKPLFGHYLPAKEVALELSDYYYKHAAWMCRPCLKEEFLSTLLEPIYSCSTSENWWEKLHSHQLAVFFMILAIGMLHAPGDEDLNYLDGRRYYALSCASLSMNSMIRESTCSTVQALCLMLYYHVIAELYTAEMRWLILGLCDRLCSRIGLQRDGTLWNLPAEETHRRRVIFWEIYTYHIWTSFVFGRPAGRLEQFADCRYPDEPIDGSEAGSDLSLHGWKYRFAANCVSRSLAYAFNPKQPDYSALFELDRMIRKFPAPAWMHYPTQASTQALGDPPDGETWSTNPDHALAQYYNLFVRESTLLYLHRSFMVHAMMLNPENPLNTKYGASVMAVYRSASLIVWGLRGFQQAHPSVTPLLCAFWSGYYSACIPIAALIIRSPRCPLSKSALTELEKSLPAFVACVEGMGTDADFADLLKDMYRRACLAMSSEPEMKDGRIPSDASSEVGSPGSRALDDLFFLGGRSILIKNSSNTGSSPTRKGTATDVPATASGAEQQTNTTLGSWNDSTMIFDAGEYPMPLSNDSQYATLPRERAAVAQQSLTMPEFYGAIDTSYMDINLASMPSVPIIDTIAAIPGQWGDLQLPQSVLNPRESTPVAPPLDDAWQKFLLEMGFTDSPPAGT